MKELMKIVVWFFVLNCCVNSIIPEPTEHWLLIEIIIIIFSIIMVDNK